MKKFMILLLPLLAIHFISSAQEDVSGHEIETLFSDQKSLGFYGGFSVGYSQIGGEDALVTGGRAALIFNHSTALGLAGYGFISNLDDLMEDEIQNYALTGGYGGIFIEPIVGGLKPVHVSFPILFGIGGVALIENYNYGIPEHPHWRTDYIEHDLIFVIEPAVELEFNLARFFRTAATLSYRYTSDVQLPHTKKDALRGVHAGLTFKFGKF